MRDSKSMIQIFKHLDRQLNGGLNKKACVNCEPPSDLPSEIGTEHTDEEFGESGLGGNEDGMGSRQGPPIDSFDDGTPEGLAPDEIRSDFTEQDDDKTDRMLSDPTTRSRLKDLAQSAIDPRAQSQDYAPLDLPDVLTGDEDDDELVVDEDEPFVEEEEADEDFEDDEENAVETVDADEVSAEESMMPSENEDEDEYATALQTIHGLAKLASKLETTNPKAAELVDGTLARIVAGLE
jgi:hypothetical protein